MQFDIPLREIETNLSFDKEDYEVFYDNIKNNVIDNYHTWFGVFKGNELFINRLGTHMKLTFQKTKNGFEVSNVFVSDAVSHYFLEDKTIDAGIFELLLIVGVKSEDQNKWRKKYGF